MEMDLLAHFKSVAAPHGGKRPVTGNEVEMFVGDHGGGAVLARGTKPFAIDHLPAGRSNTGEDPAVPD